MVDGDVRLRWNDSGMLQGSACANHGYELQFPVMFRECHQTNRFCSGGCTTAIFEIGGCYVVTPGGQTIALHRRQRTHCLMVRVRTGIEMELLAIAAVRANPVVQRLSVAGQDPGDEQIQEAASSPSPPV